MDAKDPTSDTKLLVQILDNRGHFIVLLMKSKLLEVPNKTVVYMYHA